jgi:creatinine amidohydrolase
VRAACASYWDFVSSFIAEWRESGPGGIDHACEMETSLMLALHPDSVREGEPQDEVWTPHSEFLSGDLAIGAPVTVAWSFGELSESGVLGAPSAGSRERGEELLRAVSQRIAAFLGEYREWDWSKPLTI